jgi:hypothetical protein
MPIGPGKYNQLCTNVRLIARAEAAIVIIMNGDRGSGFSIQCTAGNLSLDQTPVAAWLPSLLRHMADEIEKDSDLDQ